MNTVKRQNSGILGGTFDPVHLGHLGLATQIRDKLHLDQIWFIPAWQSPHKLDQGSTEPHHRLKMLEVALAPYPDFMISEIELERQCVSYTVDTLTDLKKMYPETDWHLILGMDAFRDFSSWKDVGEILKMAHLVVATRPGISSDTASGSLAALMNNLGMTCQPEPDQKDIQTFLCPETENKIFLCDIEPRDIASRDIRDRIRRGLSTKNLLLPEVERYIMINLLYQTNPQP